MNNTATNPVVIFGGKVTAILKTYDPFTEKYELNMKIMKNLPNCSSGSVSKEASTGKLIFEKGTLSNVNQDDEPCWVCARFLRKEGQLRISFLLPRIIDDKTTRMKSFTLELLNDDEDVVGSKKWINWPEKSEDHYHHGDYFPMYKSTIHLYGGNGNEPIKEIHLIRLTFYVDFEQVPSVQVLQNGGIIHSPTFDHPLTSLKPTLGEYYNSAMLADVIISCHGKEYPAHQLILSLASPVFKAMFENKEMKEVQERRLEIKDLDTKTVELLLKWMYSGEVTLSLVVDELDEYLNLFKGADKYCIDPLKNWVASQIATHLTNGETAIKIFEIANHYNNEVMLEMAKQVIRLNKGMIFGNKLHCKEFMKNHTDFMCELMLD